MNDLERAWESVNQCVRCALSVKMMYVGRGSFCLTTPPLLSNEPVRLRCLRRHSRVDALTKGATGRVNGKVAFVFLEERLVVGGQSIYLVDVLH
jgi:hypothetical protein